MAIMFCFCLDCAEGYKIISFLRLWLIALIYCDSSDFAEFILEFPFRLKGGFGRPGVLVLGVW